jgi:tetrahydromethanopterin S-methyltransferase subunit C
MIISGLILLFTGITPFDRCHLISTDSNYQTSGFLIAIGWFNTSCTRNSKFNFSWGLLKGKRWARTITLIISFISIIIAIISLVSSRDLIHIISVIICGIIIYYMFTNKVKLFFGKVKESTS